MFETGMDFEDRFLKESKKKHILDKLGKKNKNILNYQMVLQV